MFWLKAYATMIDFLSLCIHTQFYIKMTYTPQYHTEYIELNYLAQGIYPHCRICTVEAICISYPTILDLSAPLD